MAGRIGLPYRDSKKAEPYAAALLQVGLEPALLPPGSPPELRSLGGILLMGGTDVDPRLYGAAPHPATHKPDRERDEFELALAAQAWSARLPLFAICRGMQLLNVARGGSLQQHLETQVPHMVRPHAPPGCHPAAHTIAVDPSSALAAIFAAENHLVNSRHHQAVERPGRGLVVSATAPDGVIEALEADDGRFAIAVQWHPEDRIRISLPDLRLFEALREAVERQGTGAGTQLR